MLFFHLDLCGSKDKMIYSQKSYYLIINYLIINYLIIIKFIFKTLIYVQGEFYAGRLTASLP